MRQAGPEVPQGTGRIVALWGPKGSPGTSTVALNLAFELSALKVETLLVDADVYGGTLAQSLDVDPEAPGLPWLAHRLSREGMEPEEARSMAKEVCPGGPRFLPGLPRAELWTEVPATLWPELAELFRKLAAFTLVDLAFCLEEEEELMYDMVRLRRNGLTRAVLASADTVLAVSRADPVGLRSLILAWPALVEAAGGEGKVEVVLNRTRGGGARYVREASELLQEHLGKKPVALIPEDPEAFWEAMRHGRALREMRRRSQAQLALAELALVLVGSPSLPKRGLLSRLGLRRRAEQEPIRIGTRDRKASRGEGRLQGGTAAGAGFPGGDPEP